MKAHKKLDKQTFHAHLFDGMSVMVGGFMTCGTPERLIDWMLESGVKNLTVICNDAGYPEAGVGKLIAAGRVSTLIASHIGLNPIAGSMMGAETLAVTLVPQGTLAEQIRAKGAGLGGILTPTGLHTPAEAGKSRLEVDGKPYILERPIGADIALIKAREADQYGNLNYAKTARNFNPVMATAANLVFVEATCRSQAMDPETVITPHVLVDYILTEVSDGR
ncbi:MAG: 3-oxoacid CoA-transferase subunit A [Acholeplasmatales bacterium]|nr:MAG: 3-oxoacid CoA-transferase subunit A [Acholeplasmatales bacterium]